MCGLGREDLSEDLDFEAGAVGDRGYDLVDWARFAVIGNGS